MSTQVTPKSIQTGIPRLTKPRTGYRQVKLGDILYEEKRPIKMLDSKRYRLVTVKRSRGGIEERSKLLGKAISVKSQFKIAENDFLISKRQIVHGACVLVPKEFEGSIVSNEYAVLRARPELDIRYLKYLSHSVYFQQTCFHSSIGIHVEKMIFKLGDWFNWSVNLPNLEEQRKFANFLTSVDNKIQQLKRKHALMKQYEKGVMEQLFSQQVRFKNDDNLNYPDWTEVHLESLCESIMSGKSKKTSSGDFPVYGSTGVIGFSQTATHHGKFILVARVGANAGKLNYVDDYFSVTDNTLVIDLKNRSSVYFAYTLLKTLNLNRFVFGSGQPLITGNLLKKLKVNIPASIEEQQKIAVFCAAIDKKVQLLQDQLTQVENFKKGLLEQIFV